MTKFTARYPGRCPACGDPIDIGEDLTWDDDQAVHFTCAGRPRISVITERAREVCPRCFVEKAVNGACACEEDR